MALLAAGGALAALTEVMEGRVRNAYALVRPPGHHAERDLPMGFCFVNNIAVAAAHAMEVFGLQRVAIVDWDVHHGVCACVVGVWRGRGGVYYVHHGLGCSGLRSWTGMCITVCECGGEGG